jgi:hypothetical protein
VTVRKCLHILADTMELQTQIQRRESTVITLPPLVLDRNEAAGVLRISTRKLDYLIERGSIAPLRIDGRVLVAWDELLRFVESMTSPGHGSRTEPERNNDGTGDSSALCTSTL